MKKVGNWFAASWSGILLFVVLLAGLIFLLGFNLGDLVPGLSKNEVTQASSSRTLESIVNNSLGLPHKGVQFITQRVQVSATSVRAASALIGLVSIGCLYYVLSNWHTKRIALIGTLLFSTSAWFLHVSRLGTDISMYFLLFFGVACAIWLQKSKGSTIAVFASAALVISLLYIPGMIWFVAPVLLWQVSRIGQILEGQNTGMLTLLGLLALALLVPLGWSMYQNPDFIKTYFGLPQIFPSPMDILGNLANIPAQLFFRGANNPEAWLARVPLLNIFVSIMFLTGLYVYLKARGLDRTRFLLYVFVVSCLLLGLGGPVNIAILLPFVYLVAASGVTFLLQQWFAVFPKNPFARSIGLTIMLAVVLLASYNGISHYFVAWPNTPDTKQAFQETLQ